MIDREIQDAYIQATRRAKNFIYIESQYFIRSEFDWSRAVNGIEQKDTIYEALNLIPIEVSLKIVSKIKKEDKFVVYVVIPMWLEGHPNGRRRTVQDILYREMQMPCSST
ncbi:phospholipase D alpha 1-like [Arachis hypogaea]|uniref:phospholipase D alpha 1-like n=1 Tax=Arachis hypogaea TaxID=3818 RepID=UPI003B21093A